MRKIKIFLTMLAVAGVLFATSSCVDNTESDSIADLRKAKAEELRKNGTYLEALGEAAKTQAAAAKALADGQAKLLEAQAVTEAAQQKYLEALAEKEAAFGQAEVLKAEAGKLKAIADTITSSAQAKATIAQIQITLAQAYAIESAAQAAAKAAEEELAIQKRRNLEEIAKIEDARALAEEAAKAALITAQQALITAQIEYLKAVSDLQLEAAAEYVSIIGSLTTVRNTIITETSNIARYNAEIAKINLELATYSIDSARFVDKYKVQLQATINKENLALKYAERDLKLWESFDTDLEVLKEAKAQLIQDTLDATEALAAAIAKEVELAADTVTASEAKKVAQAKADAEEAIVKGLAYDIHVADSLLKDYIAVSAGWYFSPFDGSYYIFDGQYYSPSYGNPDYSYDPIGDGSSITGWSDRVDLPEYKGRAQYIYFYKNEQFDATSSEVSTTEYGYIYAYTYDSQIATKYDLAVRIAASKVDTATKANDLKKYTTDLNLALDSVRKYSDLVVTTEAARVVAYINNENAYKLYDAALLKFEASAKGTPDTIAVNAAALPYNGQELQPTGWVSTSTALYNNSTLGKLAAANSAKNSAVENLNTYKNAVRTNIKERILAKHNYDYSVSNLSELEKLITIFEDGSEHGATRDKLQLALEDATNIHNEYIESDKYNDAISANDDAKDTLDAVLGRYEFHRDELSTAEDSYEQAIEAYKGIEWIEFQIETGGVQALLDQKEDQYLEITSKIEDLKASLAKNTKLLADVANVAPDTDKGKLVAKVIEGYKSQIEGYEGNIKVSEQKIAEAEQKVKYYEAALDALEKALNELSE